MSNTQDHPFLPYGRQSIDAVDIAAVERVLHSDWLTTGPAVEQFEAALASYLGAKHAIAVSNGTAALHVAMLAAGITKGDRVVTSANTFLASANAAAFVGATPDFADIDPTTYTISPQSLKATWQEDTRAVVPVAFAGQSANMPRLAEIARSRGALLIEDACHGIGGGLTVDGSTYKSGGHPWADMTTFSFHPVKTITTGEGGAIVTDDDNLADKCRHYRNHGMTREKASFKGLGSDKYNEVGPWYYEMHSLGYNYRITDLQCALGISQLSKLDAFVTRRAEIVAAYNTAFATLEHVTTPSCWTAADPAWHLYVVQIDFDNLGLTRSEVMEQLHARGVGSQVHYIPVHLQPYYRERFGYLPGKCPMAESFYGRALSLPLYPTMTDADIQRVIDEVIAILAR